MKTKIAVLGEAMLELKSLDNGLYEMGVAGDVYNSAAMMAQLGADVSFVSSAGTGQHAERLLRAFKDNKVNCATVLPVEQKNPGLYLIKNSESGERSFSYWRNDSAAKTLFSSVDRFKHALEPLNSFSHIYWSGITLAIQSSEVRKLWIEYLSAFRAQGGAVFFDSNFRPQLWEDTSAIIPAYQSALRECDYYLPSLEDEQAIFNLHDKSEVLKHLKSLHSLSVLTADAEAILVHEQNSQSYALEFSSAIVDATGAGDAFSGAFCYAITNNYALSKAIRMAHVAASNIVQIKGALPTAEQWPGLCSAIQESAYE